MKWIKRLIVAAVTVVVMLAVASVVLHRLAHARPDWYPSRIMDKASRGAAARSVEDKLAAVQSWALDTNANERNRQGKILPGAPGYVAAPDPIQHLSLSEPELNAFFEKWGESLHWKDGYSKFVDDPVLALQDNQIILAGTLKEAGLFISLHMEPSLDPDGKLRLKLARVMGGRLTLPRALWNGYRDQLHATLSERLGRSRDGAAMVADGSMNKDAMAAAMDELLLHALDDESAEPYLFLPHDNFHPGHAFPVKVTGVKIANKTLDLTVVPPSPEERDAFLKQIREPMNEAKNKDEGGRTKEEG